MENGKPMSLNEKRLNPARVANIVQNTVFYKVTKKQRVNCFIGMLNANKSLIGAKLDNKFK